MKKSLVLASILSIGTLALSVTGCGDDTVLETGTYACKDSKNTNMDFLFNLEDNTWDAKMNNKFMSSQLPSTSASLILSKQDKKAKEYTLSMNNDNKQVVIFTLSKKGDIFIMNSPMDKTAKKDQNLTCQKQ